MGHANVSNISEFFIKRLYAKGQLSIRDCVQGLIKAGEELHASEGDYADEGMLGMAVGQYVHYLNLVDPSKRGYSGPEGGGPWIVEAVSVWLGKPREVPDQVRRGLKMLEDGDNRDEGFVLATADVLMDAGRQPRPV